MLAVPFTGLAAVGLGTKTLALALAVIRKKKYLAVLALTAARNSFHRFPNQGNQHQTIGLIQGKKNPSQEDPEPE